MPLLDFRLLLFIAPALILGFLAQMMVRSTFARSSQVAARMSGYAAARHVLDGSGLYDVQIEQIPGHLSDHYDPHHKVLRLSSEVYHGRNMSAVGVAAHEAGHALQDAKHYAPLMIRNAAVPAASFGSNAGILLAALGVFLGMQPLLLIGIAVFAGVVFFQVVNLPVEFNASTRAKRELVDLGIINQQELPYVRKVLNAAALTYVAATLQSILTLLYYLLHFMGGRSDD
jgi:Zn-dependent membrane protease YugP